MAFGKVIMGLSAVALVAAAPAVAAAKKTAKLPQNARVTAKTGEESNQVETGVVLLVAAAAAGGAAVYAGVDDQGEDNDENNVPVSQ